LAREGFALLLARPWPALALGRAVSEMPFVLDAWTQRVEAVTLSGERFETVAAPRSATGPSLVHTLACQPPLARLVRAHLRIAPINSQARRARTADARAAARLFVDVMEEGRAVAVEAVGDSVTALLAPGTRAQLSGAAAADFAHVAPRPFHRMQPIVPSDRSSVEAALHAGLRVVGAPPMNRAAICHRPVSGLEEL
jgi:hypothetical protein